MTSIGVISEAPDLDFKSALTSNDEVAKDVAAMTIQGGVLVYGVDEDAHGTATAIAPIPLANTPEKLQQIVDSAIWPAPVVDITSLADPSAPDRGVVVVAVPPSTLAPHYAKSRFPARSGTTTRYLAEREIATLYEQRRAVMSSAEERRILDGYTNPPDAPDGMRGIGVLRVLARPVAPLSHPKGVHLKRPLAAAVDSSQHSLAWLSSSDAVAFDFLSKGWRPYGSLGWQAGFTSAEFETLRTGRTAAAVCRHDLAMSFMATVPLGIGGGPGLCAYEHLWTAEALAFLLIAGNFLADVPGAAMLDLDIEVQGLGGSVSWVLCQGLNLNTVDLRASDSNYLERTQATPREILKDPVEVARRMLDRLLISFVPEETDVFVRLKSML